MAGDPAIFGPTPVALEHREVFGDFSNSQAMPLRRTSIEHALDLGQVRHDQVAPFRAARAIVKPQLPMIAV